MELKGIGRVTVRRGLFQIRWNVDNVDGFKGTLFDTDTATNAKRFRNKCNLGSLSNLDTKLA
jgi:hypothetical protein